LSDIGIVTVITNEKKNLPDFYTSLVEQTFKNFTLYFVDNNSSDGSQQFFRELNTNNLLCVSYITLDYNSGFAGGSNTGAVKAIKDGCKYLFILNSDVELKPGCLEELVCLMNEDDKIACAGLLLMRHKENFPGLIQEFGGSINFNKGKLEKYFENKALAEVDLPEVLETDFVGGGACFIKADVFKEIGMFEESYFGYFDEIDLSYRLKAKRDYKMFVSSKAIAFHNHNWSKKEKRSYYYEYYLSERNKFLFFKKHKLYSGMIKGLFVDIIRFPRRLFWFRKVCDFKLGFYYLKGMLHGILGKTGKPYFI
jgi:GT2 family glycosyltransferase